MPKGFNTQAVIILLENAASLDQIREVLWDFGKSDDTEPSADPTSWALGSKGFAIFYDGPKKAGAVLLDVVEKPWPDQMGSPEEDPMLFMAWTMGQFGPGTFPGSLERACQQSWSWSQAEETVQKHTAFIRLRLTYMVGQENDAEESDSQETQNNPSDGADTVLIPEGYDASDAMHELAFLDDIAKSLLDLPGALCYFNPSGETVLPAEILAERSAMTQDSNVPNLSSWANIRLFNVNEKWSLMDSVGNLQMETPDMEILVPADNDEGLNDYDSFIRNVTWYLMQNPGAIQDGHTVDGPGDQTFRASFFENSLIMPPRDVILWLPTSMETLPEGFPERDTTPSEPDGEEDQESAK